MEDVEAVCVGDGIDRTEVVTLLRRLVATSWVMRERGGTAPHIGCWRPRASTRWTSSSHLLRRRRFGASIPSGSWTSPRPELRRCSGAGSNALVRPHRIGTRQLQNCSGLEPGRRGSRARAPTRCRAFEILGGPGTLDRRVGVARRRACRSARRGGRTSRARAGRGVVPRLLSRSARVGAFDGD